MLLEFISYDLLAFEWHSTYFLVFVSAVIERQPAKESQTLHHELHVAFVET